MVGSEGTLGIFTKITLKLLPLPKASVDLLCLFKTAEEAIAAVPTIMTTGGIIPTAIEFMDQTSRAGRLRVPQRDASPTSRPGRCC